MDFPDFQPMSPDEMQRAMQFILNQQAQFTADLARHREQVDADMAALAAKTDRIADGLIGLTGLVGRAVDALSAAQLRTDEQVRELRDQTRQTDAHLNLVIEMFEGHLREDHGRA